MKLPPASPSTQPMPPSSFACHPALLRLASNFVTWRDIDADTLIDLAASGIDDDSPEFEVLAKLMGHSDPAGAYPYFKGGEVARSLAEGLRALAKHARLELQLRDAHRILFERAAVFGDHNAQMRAAACMKALLEIHNDGGADRARSLLKNLEPALSRAVVAPPSTGRSATGFARHFGPGEPMPEGVSVVGAPTPEWNLPTAPASGLALCVCPAPGEPVPIEDIVCPRHGHQRAGEQAARHVADHEPLQAPGRIIHNSAELAAWLREDAGPDDTSRIVLDNGRLIVDAGPAPPLDPVTAAVDLIRKAAGEGPPITDIDSVFRADEVIRGLTKEQVAEVERRLRERTAPPAASPVGLPPGYTPTERYMNDGEEGEGPTGVYSGSLPSKHWMEYGWKHANTGEEDGGFKTRELAAESAWLHYHGPTGPLPVAPFSVVNFFQGACAAIVELDPRRGLLHIGQSAGAAFDSYTGPDVDRVVIYNKVDPEILCASAETKSGTSKGVAELFHGTEINLGDTVLFFFGVGPLPAMIYREGVEIENVWTLDDFRAIVRKHLQPVSFLKVF